jgi:hypothetical protein
MFNSCVEFSVLISLVHSRYNDRLRERLQEFAVSMSSVSQIYFHIMNSERRRVKMLPCWRRFWYWKKSKHSMFMEALAAMSDIDIAKITEEALGYRLPQFNQHSKRSDTSFRRRAMASPPSFDDNIIKMTEAFEAMLAEEQAKKAAEHAAKVPSSFQARSGSSSHGMQATVAGGTELLEVVVSGGSSDAAAGVGQGQCQQQRPNERDAAAAEVSDVRPESTPRAAVMHTKTVAALAIKVPERGANRPRVVKIQTASIVSDKAHPVASPLSIKTGTSLISHAASSGHAAPLAARSAQSSKSQPSSESRSRELPELGPRMTVSAVRDRDRASEKEPAQTYASIVSDKAHPVASSLSIKTGTSLISHAHARPFSPSK